MESLQAMEAYATPNALWFVRHHHPVPIVDENEYALEVHPLHPYPSTLNPVS